METCEIERASGQAVIDMCTAHERALPARACARGRMRASLPTRAHILTTTHSDNQFRSERENSEAGSWASALRHKTKASVIPQCRAQGLGRFRFRQRQAYLDFRGTNHDAHLVVLVPRTLAAVLFALPHTADTHTNRNTRKTTSQGNEAVTSQPAGVEATRQCTMTHMHAERQHQTAQLDRVGEQSTRTAMGAR